MLETFDVVVAVPIPLLLRQGNDHVVRGWVCDGLTRQGGYCCGNQGLRSTDAVWNTALKHKKSSISTARRWISQPERMLRKAHTMGITLSADAW